MDCRLYPTSPIHAFDKRYQWQQYHFFCSHTHLPTSPWHSSIHSTTPMDPVLQIHFLGHLFAFQKMVNMPNQHRALFQWTPMNILPMMIRYQYPINISLAYFNTLNLYAVWLFHASPGFKTADGKLDWLGASGNCWVSKQKPERY